MAGCDGARRWIDRVYRLFIESGKITDTNDGKLDKVYNQTVKKVTEDYEALGFNTAISQMMIFVNEAYKADTVYKPYAEGIVKMLSCITPHIGEEMWQLLGHEDTIAYEPWPTYDEAKLVEDTITCVCSGAMVKCVVSLKRLLVLAMKNFKNKRWNLKQFNASLKVRQFVK